MKFINQRDGTFCQSEYVVLLERGVRKNQFAKHLLDTSFETILAIAQND